MPARKLHLHGAAAALLIITALLQLGCGTQATTSPQQLSREGSLEGPPGEVIVPEPVGGGKLSVPVNFVAESIGTCIVVLTWSAPAEPVDAVISLDGMHLVRQPASSTYYLDMCGKTAGPHTYELQYATGLKMGPVETRIVTIDPHLGDGSGLHEPRPEQGLR